MKKDFKYREIPFNYTSFSDREIILRYFDEEAWDLLNDLREKRKTGRSAKLLFENIGEIFIIDRNPYIFNDFLENANKRRKMQKMHERRLKKIAQSTSNEMVQKLVEKARDVENDFFQSFAREKKQRKKIHSALSSITHSDNIQFTAFHKVSHVTDATDLRVEYPQVIVYPETEAEVVKLVKAARDLDLKIIPRGGGTGLTGGAVPLYDNIMIINTEKLRRIGEVEQVEEGGIEFPVVEAQAGVVTEILTLESKRNGYVFAPDPTSSWASTIGGNIAENAGGKKAVMWGTAIDSIYSFRLVDARGALLEVQRRNHPHRKIQPDDIVIYDVYQLHRKKDRELLRTIELKGTDIRKPGVGKDITNKALGGVPAIQKEGGDGIILSAKFVLFKPFKYSRTICLEFFGNNMVNASQAIVEIRDYFDRNRMTNLTALEHWDEKYNQAISYRNKSDRSEMPIAVLLIDVEGDDEQHLDQALEKVDEIVKPYNTESIIAYNEQMRTLFWKDRKNLGAIARHTNAFKMNEDVVIPIEALPGFADFIDKLNLTRQLENNCDVVRAVREYLVGMDISEDDFLHSKRDLLLEKLNELEETFSRYKTHIETPVKDVYPDSDIYQTEKRTIFEMARDGEIDVSIDEQLVEIFRKTFHGYDEIITSFDELVNDIVTKKIIIATHMHAGDGNIHVNIPVHSSDYQMMKHAEETAGIVMKKTVELGGVISGEHGIGLTKMHFIDQETLDAYADYKEEYDPDDLFNPGKLRSDFPISRVYTPSFNLLGMEAFILEVADMESLLGSMSGCVRCGKCKEVCNTHYPATTMFYNPRNKILAVFLIAEAVLFESQTSHNLSFRYFKMLQEVSDHCTMCHNCYKPCPVKIDFGEVTLAIRELLVARKRKHTTPVTALTLFYLKRRGYYVNKIFRIGLLKIAYSMQRLAATINRPFRVLTEKVIPYVGLMLHDRLPRAGNQTLRELLGLKASNAFYAFANPKKEIVKSVFYFPGCGSERMFSDISMATIALLYDAGVRVVIPPDYLCCGYPLLANGKKQQAEIKSYENRVIFHRMADTVGYMGIEDVLVTCGTCHEMLGKYRLENIFPNANLIDANEFIARENLYSTDQHDMELLYHEPCHTPLKEYGYEETFEKLLNAKPVSAPNCCGEGGTMALSTPDISNSLRKRKGGNIATTMKKIEKTTVLTTCPSCTQGLSKICEPVSIQGKSLVVYLAETFLGKNWKKAFIKKVKNQKGMEEILM